MRFSKQTKKISLIGAVTALCASIGMISTGYAEPTRLSNSQMDAVTAGAGGVCPECVSGPAPTVDGDWRETGVLRIQWDAEAARGPYQTVELQRVLISSYQTGGSSSVEVFPIPSIR